MIYCSRQSSSSLTALFPPEIWQNIYAHACMDDGRTGCSLALVSRYVCDLSARTRFQSVAVSGLHRFKSLLDLLQRTPQENRRIRFLCVTEPPQTDTRSLLSSAYKVARDDWQATYDAFITLVASHLEVFSLAIEWYAVHIAPRGVQFPQLRDLSAFGSAFIDSPSFSDARQLPPLPSLRRLHVIGTFNASHVLPHLAGVQNLDCLRLSRIRWESDIVHLLGTLLGIEECAEQGRRAYARSSGQKRANVDISQIAVLKTLRKLIIEPGLAPTGKWCTHGDPSQLSIYALPALFREHGDGHAQITVLPVREAITECASHTTKVEWRHVTELGGAGAWGVEESVQNEPQSVGSSSYCVCPPKI
jgi:hypothetical protein